MKQLKITILTALIAVTGLTAFGQGYVTFSASTSRLWDEFTTAGAGVRGNANINVAFIWTVNGAADLLPAVGSQFSSSAQAANHQVATNGVSSTQSGLSALQSMLSGGWNFASNGVSLASTTIQAAGQFGYGQFQVNGISAGATATFIVIGWDATSGLTAILNGTETALGWSNPFSYQTGANASDPFGTTLFSSAGMNQFGVAPAAVPEPTTLALAGLGAASLLVFRRRKQ